MNKVYSELKRIPTFMGRFEYLALGGRIGEDTFGYERYLNQMLYRSRRWKSVREKVIIRDCGCDLGVDGYLITGKRIIVHHMNPITVADIEEDNPDMYDMEYLISVSHKTHQAITFGNESLLPPKIIVRRPNDTIPWR